MLRGKIMMTMMTVENVVNWSDAAIEAFLAACDTMFASGYSLETGEQLTEADYKLLDKNYLICESELNRRRVKTVEETGKKDESVSLNPLIFIDDDVYEDAGIHRKRTTEDYSL